MQIIILMWSPKVNKSRKSGAGASLNFAPKVNCQIMDLFILVFLMHEDVRKDAFDCFDMHLRPFNA